MALLGGLLGKLIALAVLLLLLAVVVVGWFVATDQSVEATVTEKDCQASPPTITAVTKLFSMERVVDVTAQECALISVGNFVEYHVRSGRTTVYEMEGGRCIYDSQTGAGCGQALTGLTI